MAERLLGALSVHEVGEQDGFVHEEPLLTSSVTTSERSALWEESTPE